MPRETAVPKGGSLNAQMSAADMRLILTTAQLDILLSAHPCAAPHPWLLRDMLWLASRGLLLARPDGSYARTRAGHERARVEFRAARGRRLPERGSETEKTMKPHRLDVLIADDNRDAADSLADLVRSLGYEVAATYNGRAAVEAAEASRPRVAILDVEMPLLDGCAAAKAIRSQPMPPRLIASLTCLDPSEEPLKSGARHFDLRLDKPLRFEQLREALDSALGPRL